MPVPQRFIFILLTWMDRAVTFLKCSQVWLMFDAKIKWESCYCMCYDLQFSIIKTNASYVILSFCYGISCTATVSLHFVVKRIHNEFTIPYKVMSATVSGLTSISSYPALYRMCLNMGLFNPKWEQTMLKILWKLWPNISDFNAAAWKYLILLTVNLYFCVFF